MEKFSHALKKTPLSANHLDNITIYCAEAHAAKGYSELAERFRSFSHSQVQGYLLFHNHLSELSLALSLVIASLSVPELFDMAPVKEAW